MHDRVQPETAPAHPESKSSSLQDTSTSTTSWHTQLCQLVPPRRCILPRGPCYINFLPARHVLLAHTNQGGIAQPARSIPKPPTCTSCSRQSRPMPTWWNCGRVQASMPPAGTCQHSGSAEASAGAVECSPQSQNKSCRLTDASASQHKPQRAQYTHIHQPHAPPRQPQTTENTLRRRQPLQEASFFLCT